MYLKLISLLLHCFLVHNVQSVALTCDDIRYLVDGHNDRRLRLAKGEVENQPPASGMQYLIWDNELEEKANRWAAQYTTMSDPDETIGSDRFKINQNIYKVLTSDEDYKVNMNDVVDYWFNENTKYTFGPDTSYDDEFGDYLRMAQAKAKYIGCGIDETDEDGMKAFYVVCN